MRFKIGDNVKITLGKDRGKTGKIETVLPKKQQVVIAGINMFKRHIKKQGDKAGQIVDRPRPLATAKIALICPHCHQPTRIGYELDKKTKLRICRKCGKKL